LFAGALVSTLWIGMRSYRSWLLLRSAYAVNAPDLGNIRAWMTLGYVSGLYGPSERILIERMGLPPGTPSATTLRSLAESAGVSPFAYVQRMQQAIADVEPNATAARGNGHAGWLNGLSDTLLAGLLLYGYPALAAVLILGSIGVPLPDGLVTAAAGSLIAQQHMSWAAAGAVAVGATVAGDMVGYYLGRFLGGEFLNRRGTWIGYTAARRDRAQALFAHWGWAGVLLTRTLASSVSSVANLAAGAIRYRPAAFLGNAVAGRILWTSAYLGLGYGVSGALDAANGFLGSVTGVLVGITITVWAGWLLFKPTTKLVA